MKMPVSHYCQRCLAANPLGQEFCARCGTRLMIVVEPAAGRYEIGDQGVSTEEHLLERISGLENRQARLTEKLERALDLLLRQAQNSHFDRALVKALADLLTDDGIIENDRLERLWINRCQKDAEEQQESERREVLRLRILAKFSGNGRASFEHQVNQGFLLIEDEQVGSGIRALQRAAELSPKNAPLLSFLGEHFYKSGKTSKARSFLSRAHEIDAGDERLQLLLGLTCADEGDAERAKALLRGSTHAATFAAHFGLGRLFAAQNEWKEAAREFKLALVRKDSPEAHYALGCLYYQQGRDALATRHLRKAVTLDDGYNEALHLLGLIARRGGHEELANRYFEKAGTGSFVGPTSRKRQAPDTEDANTGFRLSPARSRKLITEAEKRLADALRQDALSADSSTEKKSVAARR
jgi:Flp pilus assembly protein TadD